MDMKAYLKEMEHAVTLLIPVIWSEHELVDKLAADLRKREVETDRGYRQAAAFGEDDDDGLGTAIYWDTYFGADKERHHAKIALTGEEARYAAHAFSCSASSAALLQYAKQGLSAVHGTLARAPAGRQIHGLDLKTVIWEGRNQALHWEEADPHKGVIACFDKLKAADNVFDDYVTSNMAFEVIRTLGWRNWYAFERDMLALG